MRLEGEKTSFLLLLWVGIMPKEKAKKEEKEEKKPAAPVKGAPAAPVAKGAAKKGAPVEAAAPEEKKEEKKKEKKSQKERPKSKKKHAKVQVWKLYKVEGNSLKRKNEYCPRCGAGTFLASYKNRKYCGKCSFSEITTVKQVDDAKHRPKDEEKVKGK